MANKLHEIFVKNGGAIMAVDTTSGPESVLSNKIIGTSTPPPIKIPAMSFHVKSNGDLEWYTEPQQNTVELIAEEIIDRNLLSITDATSLDKYIKTQLAQKIAQKIIEEDLIEIYSDLDINSNIQRFKAKIKFVQE